MSLPLRHWAWLCPIAAILAAAAILTFLGLTFWHALLAALLLVCPALLIWGAIVNRGRRARARRHAPAVGGGASGDGGR